MKRPVFYFERLKPWDIWTILIYAIVSIGVFCNLSKEVLFVYTILTHLFIYVFNYKSLRNLSVYLIWLLFGISHFVIYAILKEGYSLETEQVGGAVLGLRNTIILLVIFQILRVLSLNIQHQELVAPARGNTTDIFDERRVNWLDNFLFVIYVACAFGLIALER
jgi:hypothetical protein